MTTLESTASFAECFEAFRPRDNIGWLEWNKAHTKNNEGRPYDHYAYPHIGAPGGPADAFDAAWIREIYLQWASRCGKTFFGQASLQYVAAVMPCPMMFASSSQKIALEIIDRTYAMIEQNVMLEPLLPPKHRRKQDRIDLRDCEMHVAWARSKDTLADKNVKVGHANELDKWEHISTSTEGDPFKLFMDRGKQFAATKKFIMESTPAVKGRSRIEDGLRRSSDCRFFVPCPHCGRYQSLRMGREYCELRKLPGDHRPGGLRFNPRAANRYDVFTARASAYYQCERCEDGIQDHHRALMMRRGVWVPRGCEVDDEGAALVSDAPEPFRGWHKAVWVKGKPDNDGPAAGYQLSSLYALSLGWGDIAAEFVDSYEKPQLLRNFVNQWLGDTWELIHRGQTWEQLYERLAVDLPHATVPEGYAVITAAIDKQEDHYVYLVIAWGPENVGHIIDYGVKDDLESVTKEVLTYQYPCQDGGTLPVHFTLIDSGFRAKVVYDFVKQMRAKGVPILPCKGSSTALQSLYSINELGENTSAPGLRLVNIDTINTQEWAERRLHDKRIGEPGSLSLYAADRLTHQDLLEQLLNDAVVTDLDTKNYEKETWQRISTNIPNDFRDCLRYASVAMLIATKGRPIKARQRLEEPKPQAPKPTEQRRRDPPKRQDWLSRRPY